MKRIILIFCLLFIIYFMWNASEPTASLRLRVIADSDEKSAQETKVEVAEALEEVFENESFESAEAVEVWIEDNLEVIENTCREALDGKNTDFEIEVRDEFYEKGFSYGVWWPEGEYRSLVITLGEGKGHNFWGTLFPNITSRVSAAGGEGRALFVFSKGTNLIECRSLFLDKLLSLLDN